MFQFLSHYYLKLTSWESLSHWITIFSPSYSCFLLDINTMCVLNQNLPSLRTYYCGLLYLQWYCIFLCISMKMHELKRFSIALNKAESATHASHSEQWVSVLGSPDLLKESSLSTRSLFWWNKALSFALFLDQLFFLIEWFYINWILRKCKI